MKSVLPIVWIGGMSAFVISLFAGVPYTDQSGNPVNAEARWLFLGMIVKAISQADTILADTAEDP